MMACEHLVQFYDTEDELVSAVTPYLAAGLDADETVLVIATESHRVSFERELVAMDPGLEEAIAAGTYVAVDAAEILRYLQAGRTGEIRVDDFDVTIGMLVHRQLASGRPLRAYGEVVALMWDRGDVAGAVALEEMWNELKERQPFTLFCSYPVIGGTRQMEALQRVCRAHSFVLPAIADDDPERYHAPLSADFSPDIEAPRRVRALLRSMLSDLQFGGDLTERLTLVASELAANAVLHAQTPFRLLVQPRTASVWIAVEDRDPLKTRLGVVGRAPHGLGLIAGLALRWGVTPRKTGKVVWAEIPH